MNKQEKIKFVEVLAKEIVDAKALYLADYKGIKVNDDVKLRRELRKSGIVYKVIKNSLLKKAFEKVDIEIPEEYLIKPSAILMTNEDPINPAKIVTKFAKDTGIPSFKFGYMEGTLFNSEEVETLSKLPSKEELLSKILWLLQSPISGFTSALNEIIVKFIRVIDAVKIEKEKLL